MKRKSLNLLVLLVLGISWLLVSCGALKFIPKGSESIGIYKGTFFGQRNMGNIRVHLYQTPEGVKLFVGNFSRISPSRDVFFRGKMTTDTLEGELRTPASGTITGQLSSDGDIATGSYNLTFPGPDKGTWEANKK